MIDQTQLTAIAQCGIENVMELLNRFEKELPSKIRQIEASLANKDQGTAREILHQIKGTFASFGMTSAQHQAEDLESQAKGGNLENLADLANTAKKSFPLCYLHLKELSENS